MLTCRLGAQALWHRRIGVAERILAQTHTGQPCVGVTELHPPLPPVAASCALRQRTLLVGSCPRAPPQLRTARKPPALSSLLNFTVTSFEAVRKLHAPDSTRACML